MALNIKMIHTTKVGDVMVTNNSVEQYLQDEEGRVLETYPVGLVCRWIPGRNKEPECEIIPGKLLDDFKTNDEIRDYILASGILK